MAELRKWLQKRAQKLSAFTFCRANGKTLLLVKPVFRFPFDPQPTTKGEMTWPWQATVWQGHASRAVGGLS
jgi:hypothetical protein